MRVVPNDGHDLDDTITVARARTESRIASWAPSEIQIGVSSVQLGQHSRVAAIGPHTATVPPQRNRTRSRCSRWCSP